MKPVALTTHVAALLCCGMPALAGTPVVEPIAAEPDDSGWEWSIAPYAWLPAATGDLTTRVTGQVPVDISYSDTWDATDLAVKLAAEVGRGAWAFGVDGVWSELSGSTVVDIPPLLTVTGRLEFEQFFGRAHVAYTAARSERHRFDVLGGVRFTHFAADLTVAGNLLGEIPIAFGRQADKDWFDPIIGFRGAHQLSDRWFVRYDVDVGGFGVNSDFIWEANAGFGWRFNDSVTGLFGYRGLGIDYNDRPFALDVTFHGPFVGLLFQF